MNTYIEVSPRSDYGWINLPKDSKITELRFNDSSRYLEIHYKSNSNKIYNSDGIFGYEYHIFEKIEDVKINLNFPKENRKIIYIHAVNCDNKNLLIVILKWERIL